MECLVYHSAFILYAHICRCIEATPFSVDLEVSSPNLWTNFDEENLASAKFLEEVAIHNSYHYLFHVTQSHFTCLNTHPRDFPNPFFVHQHQPPRFFSGRFQGGFRWKKAINWSATSRFRDDRWAAGPSSLWFTWRFPPSFFRNLESLGGGSFTKCLASTCWGHGILERCCLCSSMFAFWWKLRCDCQSIWNQSYITDKKRWAIYNSKPIFGYNSWRIDSTFFTALHCELEKG